MKTHKFFYLTIQGEDFDPIILKNATKLSGKIYLKGEKTRANYLKEREISQKTNRWVFVSEANDLVSINKFLLKQLKTVKENYSELEVFIKNFDASIEIVIYAGNKTDIILDTEIIKLLDQIDLKFSISFC